MTARDMPAEELSDFLRPCQWTDWGTLQHEAALGCGVGWREWVVAFSPPWEAPFFAYDCGRAEEVVEGKVDFEGLLEGVEGPAVEVVEVVGLGSGGGWQVSEEGVVWMESHDWHPGALESDGQCEFDCGMDVGQRLQTFSDGTSKQEVESPYSGCLSPELPGIRFQGKVRGPSAYFAVIHLVFAVLYGTWVSMSKRLDELGKLCRIVDCQSWKDLDECRDAAPRSGKHLSEWLFLPHACGVLLSEAGPNDLETGSRES